MPANVRVGDATKGKGNHKLPECPHDLKGTHTAGSADVLTNSKGQVRGPGDAGDHDCPHCDHNVTVDGSPDVFTNSKATHRVGDKIDETCPGEGKSVSGSPDVFSN